MANRATMRKKTLHRRKHTGSGPTHAKRIGLKPARARANSSTPRISRARLRNLRDNLDVTQNQVSNTLDKFWIIPEGEIRGTLAATQKQIGKAVEALKKAA